MSVCSLQYAIACRCHFGNAHKEGSCAHGALTQSEQRLGNLSCLGTVCNQSEICCVTKPSICVGVEYFLFFSIVALPNSS